MRSIDQHVEAGLRELRELDRRAEQAELQRLDSNATRFRVDILFTDDAATEVQFFRTAHSAVSYAHAMLRSEAPVLVACIIDKTMPHRPEFARKGEVFK